MKKIILLSLIAASCNVSAYWGESFVNWTGSHVSTGWRWIASAIPADIKDPELYHAIKHHDDHLLMSIINRDVIKPTLNEAAYYLDPRKSVSGIAFSIGLVSSIVISTIQQGNRLLLEQIAIRRWLSNHPEISNTIDLNSWTGIAKLRKKYPDRPWHAEFLPQELKSIRSWNIARGLAEAAKSIPILLALAYGSNECIGKLSSFMERMDAIQKVPRY